MEWAERSHLISYHDRRAASLRDGLGSCLGASDKLGWDPTSRKPMMARAFARGTLTSRPSSKRTPMRSEVAGGLVIDTILANLRPAFVPARPSLQPRITPKQSPRWPFSSARDRFCSSTTQPCRKDTQNEENVNDLAIVLFVWVL